MGECVCGVRTRRMQLAAVAHDAALIDSCCAMLSDADSGSGGSYGDDVSRRCAFSAVDDS
jgi:hypothetical protein